MTEAIAAPPRRLADFIRDRHGEILQRWETTVRKLKPARDLSRPALLDHIPDFLRSLADYVGRIREGEQARPDEQLPAIHALERLDVGYDLSDVVTEYSVLRRCIVEMAAKTAAPAVRSAELPRLHEAIDAAIAASVTHYSRTRERTLKALDRISTAALGSYDVGTFLPKILQVLRDTTAAIDAVSVLLVENGALHVRASVGPAAAPGEAPPLRPGECFAGRVWESKKPLAVRDAANDPTIVTGTLDKRTTRAMYGVPLEFAGQVIGVAVMGSSTTYEFSKEDLLLFRTAVTRASTLIAHAQVAREREEERNRLTTVLRVLPVGVAIGQAPSGKLVLMNAEMERIWAGVHPAEDVSGYTAYEGYDASGRRYAPDEWPLARAVCGIATERAEIHIVASNGDRRITEQAGAPIRDDSGNVVAGVVTVVDITGRKRVEQELRAALSFRDDILGVLSHDLRQPLDVIGTSAQLLLQKEGLEAYAPVFTRQLRNVDRIERLLQDLLDYARGRQGTAIPVRRRAADMAEIARPVIDSVQTLQPARLIRLETSGDLRGEWDVNRMQQVFQNLLGNAVSYSPAGSSIDVRITGSGDEVVCSVQNAGAPIPADKLPTVFEPFRRGSSSGNPSGLGLGLYIVKQIVDAHRGSVSVRSTEGEGTTFELRLPRRG